MLVHNPAHGSENVDTQWYCLLITSILHLFNKKTEQLTATDGRIWVQSTLHDKSTNKIRLEWRTLSPIIMVQWKKWRDIWKVTILLEIQPLFIEPLLTLNRRELSCQAPPEPSWICLAPVTTSLSWDVLLGRPAGTQIRKTLAEIRDII